MNHPSLSPPFRGSITVVLAMLMIPLLLLAPTSGVSAQSAGGDDSPASISQAARGLRPEVSRAVRHDVSPPLREMAPTAPIPGGDVQPWFGLPKAENKPALGPQSAAAVGDAALPTSLNPSTVPGPLTTFEGINNVNGVLPPDTIGDVGPNHYVQMVNLAMAVFDKQGNVLFGPANTNTIWNGFGGICQTQNDGDPIVLYDQIADRWMISQFALDFPDNFHECIAISQTPDPTGAWYRYDFKISSSKMNDYPHFGIWPDAYYMAVNQFDGATFGWQGQGVVAFEREQMLQGLPARMVYFDLYGISDLLGGMLPADWDGTTPPPDGAPNPFVMIDDDAWDESYPVDQLEVWSFHVDWNDVNNSRFTGPTLLPTQFPFDTSIANAPQPGTSTRLDAISDRLMNRLQYRNFGTHQSMVVNHTVNAGGNAGIRWYEMRNTGSGWQIFQEGTYSPDSNFRWMGSMAMDGSGNMALGYSVSSNSLFPSIRYTARTTADPLGTLSANEQQIKAGAGSQTHSSGRWGDYSQMSVDPIDECTFWFTTEYYQSTGNASWRTHVGSFRLPTCTGANAGAIVGTITHAASGDPLRNARVEAGYFNATTGADGTYALLVPEGAYTLTVSAYGYENATFTDVAVTKDTTTTVDAALIPIPLVTVQGVVNDGSGAGWPVYAKLAIEGYPNSPIFSDPATGQYSVDLLSGLPVTFTVTSALPGYLSATRTMTPTASHPAENFTLAVDVTSCIAPGYAAGGTSLFESFESGTGISAPIGWQILDYAGNNQTWRFDDPGNRGNRTGGLGIFATVDSDSFGSGFTQNTEMRSPTMDFSGQSSVRLAFDSLYYTYTGADTARVDVSVDGGVTWTPVFTHTTNSPEGGEHINLDISSLAANRPAVQVSFLYFDANYEWYWQVDNVLIGEQTCLPTGDGLAMGHVYDANTGKGVNGARVANGNGGSTTSMDTPLDFDLDDGFYLMAMPAQPYTLTATANRYGPASQTITVTGLAISAQNLSLPAGRLAVTDSVVMTVKVNSDPQELQVPLANLGSLNAAFTLLTVDGAQQPASPALAYASRKRKFPSKLLNDATAANVYTHDAPTVPQLTGGTLISDWRPGASVWGAAYDLHTDSLWLSSPTEQAFRYGPDGAARGPVADLSGWVTAFAADMAYDPVSRQVWAINVGGDNCLHAFDAVTGVDHGDRICPDFTVTQRGLAYNPLRDTFFTGSWNNEIVYELNRQGQVVGAANLGLAISGLAYNPATDHLFILTNADTGFDIYVVAVTGSGPGGYEILGGFDIAGLDGWDQAGLALGCDGSLWAVDQAAGTVIQAASGETDVCAWAESEWLTVTPTSGTVRPNNQETLTFTFNPQVLRPGLAIGAVHLGTDTPYGTLSIPVTLTVAHIYGASVTAAEAAQAAEPGNVVAYALTVHNSGTITDSYTLTLGGNTWTADAPANVGPIPVRGSTTVTVSVTIPGDALPGSRDTVIVTATSQTDTGQADQAQLTTTAGTFGVDAAPAMSTRTADPGTFVTHTVTITNQGTVTDSFTLTKAGNTWQTTLPGAVGPVGPGLSASAVITVRIPAGTAAGADNTATVTATSQTDNRRSAGITLRTTANTIYGITITPGGSLSKQGRPSQQVDYTLQVANKGNATDTFTVTLSGQDWTTTAPAQVGPLVGPSGNASLRVRVTVPAEALAQATDQVTVTLTSRGNAGISAQAAMTTTAETVRSARWGATAYRAETLPGNGVTITLAATNTGNAGDTYTVTVTSPGSTWSVQLDDTVGPLVPGAAASLPMQVDVPASAEFGDSQTWTVNLISQTTAAVLSTTQVRVDAVGNAVFIPHVTR